MPGWSKEAANLELVLKRLSFIFTALALVCALPARAESPWPAFAVNLNGPVGTKGSFTVSTVLVPKSEERAFLKKMVTRPEGGDPLLVVYRNQSWKPILNAAKANNHLIRAIQLGSQDGLFGENKKMSRSIAGSVSVDEMQRAGTWVAISGTGAFSVMFYLTSDVGSATAATLMTAALQVLSVRYASLFWGYLHGSGRAVQSLIARRFPNKTRAQRLAYEAGKIKAAYVYNFLTQAAFMLAINFGDTTRTFTSHELGDIALIAASGLLTSSCWDFLFSRWHQRSDEEKKLALLMKYGKQLLMM